MEKIIAPLVAAILLAGCSRKEEPAAGGAPLAVASGPVAAAQAGAEPGGGADPFTEYKLKSYATEAVANLQAMAKAAQMYYEKDHIAPDGTLLKPGFPPSVPLTPPLGSCCERRERTCAPNPKLWDHPTWKALLFSVSEPHRYSYEFTSSEKGFVARAIGDLNCNGKTGTFEIQGTIVAPGELRIGPITKQNELE